MSAPCRVCGNGDGNRAFTAREMMHGTRDVFEYAECARCGSLQIAEVPADLAPYYPGGYYAYQPSRAPRPGPVKRWLKHRWARAQMGGATPLGRALVRRFGRLPLYDWLRDGGVRFGDRVLDVGCGMGHDLVEMSDAGFGHLLGVDPFIPETVSYPGGLRVLRAGVHELSGAFDFVMLNHSLEHVADPVAMLGHVRRLLRAGGTAMVRVPVAGSAAWHTYGPDWVQLDPPRHLFVPTVRGMEILAGAAGLRVRRVVFDSTAFQFWASEQYRRGIPLHAPQSYLVDPAASPFTSEQIRGYEEEARALNRRGRGDQACFYLEQGGADAGDAPSPSTDGPTP
jgi:SAM-dependent methyltransferase